MDGVRGLFPLDPPPSAAGGQDAIADQAEPDLGLADISAIPADAGINGYAEYPESVATRAR